MGIQSEQRGKSALLVIIAACGLDVPTYVLHQVIDVPTYVLHEVIDVPTYVLHQVIDVPTYVLHQVIDVPTYALHQVIDVPTYALHQVIDVPTYVLHQVIDVTLTTSTQQHWAHPATLGTTPKPTHIPANSHAFLSNVTLSCPGLPAVGSGRKASL